MRLFSGFLQGRTTASPGSRSLSPPAEGDRGSESVDRALLLALTVGIPLFWTFRLGFYQDDWSFLAAFVHSSDPTLAGLARVITNEWESWRPIKVLVQAILFRLFALDPAGYHSANALLFAGEVLLFHSILGRLGVSRPARFAAAALLATLPNASAGRFWFAAIQGNVSIFFLLLAARVELEDRLRRAPRRLLSLASILVAGLAYEAALPLAVAIPFAAAWQAKRRGLPPWRTFLVSSAFDLCALVALGAYKLRTTNRLAFSPDSFPPWFRDNLAGVVAWHHPPFGKGFNLWRAAEIAFVDFGFAIPKSASILASGSSLALGASLLVALLLLLSPSLRHRAATASSEPSRESEGGGLLLAGLLLWLLGWSLFLLTAEVELTPTGLGTRTAGPSVIGAALVFAGLAEIAAQRLGGWIRAVVVLTMAVSGSAILVGLADDWSTAATRQRETLAAIRTALPTWPPGKALLLDGVCPYVGPAPTFEARWDLEGALRIEYRDLSIRADVVAPSTELLAEGIRTNQYGEPMTYPYGQILLFRPGDSPRPIRDRGEAALLLLRGEDSVPGGGCPTSHPGHGVPLLD